MKGKYRPQILFLQRVSIARYASAAVATAVSVRLSVLRHTLVLCRDECIFTVRLHNHPSFWRGKDRVEIRTCRIIPSERVKMRPSTVASENLTNNEP